MKAVVEAFATKLLYLHLLFRRNELKAKSCLVCENGEREDERKSGDYWEGGYMLENGGRQLE